MASLYRFIKIIHALLIVAIILLFIACNKELELDLPSPEGVPVVNCLFNSDTNLQVQLHTLAPLDSLTPSVAITNAEVFITTDGRKIPLFHDSEGHYKSDIVPVPGESYSLEVHMPGEETVYAQDYLPEKHFPEVGKLEYKPDYIIPNDLYFGQFRAFPTKVTVDSSLFNSNIIIRAFAHRKGKYFENDSAGTYQVLEEPFMENIQLFSTDLYFRNLGQDAYVVFNLAKGLQGPSHTFEVWLPEYELGTSQNTSPDYNRVLGYCYYDSDFYIEIMCGSENFISYMETAILQLAYAINPFAEPVKVHSNIQNGTGIFAGYVVKRFKTGTYYMGLDPD